MIPPPGWPSAPENHGTVPVSAGGETLHTAVAPLAAARIVPTADQPRRRHRQMPMPAAAIASETPVDGSGTAVT